MQQFISIITKTLSIPSNNVKATLSLLDEGATVPFIARYRKEQTGELDEVQITSIRDLSDKLKELEKRREYILKSIAEQGTLTPDLESKIKQANTLSDLEDIYLPYKPKRKTKASIAKEKGLTPLAKLIFDQRSFSVEDEASKYINTNKGVLSIEEALQGARDIIAEQISEDANIRQKVRGLFKRTGIIKSKVLKNKTSEGEKFKDYFEWEEPISKIPSHRLLAIRRGEKETILSMDISPDKEETLNSLKRHFIVSTNQAAKHVEIALEDAYKRLVKPSIETEFRVNSKSSADTEAIRVFTDNLKELLLSSPLGQKRILALDPGFKSGCKLVCLNAQGKLMHNTTIFPNPPQNNQIEAQAILKQLVAEYQIEAISIGNGTASRETETFVNNINFEDSPQVVVVNESGASIYSASEVAREEFPDHDVTVRGAVSIGRRLADPLAELVKLDPKSIGVGQYQHDVDQTALKKALDDTVSSAVNAVGVEVNTASKQLLIYVSGLGPTLAENIINYRNENGPFKSRKELLKVPRMGAKVFEQAAGFLRVRNGTNPLDASAVHPERYNLVKQISKDLGSDIPSLIGDKSITNKINLNTYINESLGLPTLKDILTELEKPGRDPRATFEAFSFDDSVHEIADLKVGMVLPGIVTNVTNFGAFIDVGVHQDGLVHISQLANTFVKDPNDIVKVQQQVQVTVTEVDVTRKRIALSMKNTVEQPRKNHNKNENNLKNEKSFSNQLSALKGKWK